MEENIADVTIYWNGEKRNIGTDSYIYRSFSSQISNCGGHMLEIQEIAEDKIQMDTGCFLEVRYTAPQTIRFENYVRLFPCSRRLPIYCQIAQLKATKTVVLYHCVR